MRTNQEIEALAWEQQERERPCRCTQYDGSTCHHAKIVADRVKWYKLGREEYLNASGRQLA